MTEEKKKKRKQKPIQRQKRAESQKIVELLEVLEDLEKEGKIVDIGICPQCKSPRVRRVGTTCSDMSGHMGFLPVKFECLDCRWQGRLVVKATNRKLGLKDVAIIAEASSYKE